jgi:broad specificity phosphatase PhoE
MKTRHIIREDGRTYVYLVRHAHWEPPVGPHKFNPHHPLSKKGKLQAKVLAKKFYNLKDNIDVFICSSQGRAVQTAEEISRIIEKKPIKSDSLWEINKILWTRKIYYYGYWKSLLKYKKLIRAFNNILRKNQGKIILIVAHGNLIKGILKNKQKLPLKKIKDIDYKNCYITLLKFYKEKLEEVCIFNSREPVLIKTNLSSKQKFNVDS